MSKKIFANMVAVAVMIAMAVPAMAVETTSANEGAGVSSVVLDFGFPAAADTCFNAPYPGAVVARVGGNGNTLTLFIEVDGVVVDSFLRPTNNAVTTYTIVYNNCWDLIVSVGIRGNSIISVDGDWDWREDYCDCVECVELVDAEVLSFSAVYVNNWHHNHGDNWRALTITIVFELTFSNGDTATRTVVENRVDWDDAKGSNIQKSLEWRTPCAFGKVVYDIVLSGNNEDDFVLDVEVADVTLDPRSVCTCL